MGVILSKILYDKNGNPELVILQYNEYHGLIKKAEEKDCQVKEIKDLRRYCRGRYCRNAVGYYKDSRLFCLLKGSLIEYGEMPSMKPSDLSVKESLKEQGILVVHDDYRHFILTKEYEFTSPSLAAGLVDGSSKSGPECFGSYQSKGFNLEQMKPVHSSLKEFLRENEQISIKELAGLIKKIKDSGNRIWYIENLPDQLLFSVMEHFYSDEFNFSKFPNIARVM